MTNTWIITANLQTAAFVEHGRTVDGSVTTVTVGDTPVAGINKVADVTLLGGVPAEAVASAVAAAVAVRVDDAILAANKPAERVLTGAVAVKLNAAFLLGLKSVKAGIVEFSCYGDLFSESVTFDLPVVAISDGGAEAEGESVSTETTEDSVYDAKATG